MGLVQCLSIIRALFLFPVSAVACGLLRGRGRGGGSFLAECHEAMNLGDVTFSLEQNVSGWSDL